MIGAGPAGLAVAYHLQRIGLVPATTTGPHRSPTFVVLDAASAPGGAWQLAWPELTMADVPGFDDLPGVQRPEVEPHTPASSAVPAFLALYEQTFALHVRRPVHVRAVRDLGGPDRLLAVETVETVGARARTWRTRAVVTATGSWSKPFWPAYPGRERFEGQQLHARDVRSVEEFAGRRVIVVGGGASAGHLLQRLARTAPASRAARTTWVTRSPGAVDVRAASGARPGELPAPRPMFTRLVPHGAVWTVGSVPDGVPTHVRADVIVWATGYRAALDHLAPLRLRGPGGEIPTDGTQASRDARVQLVDYAPTAATTGADRAGREAVRNLRRTLGL